MPPLPNDPEDQNYHGRNQESGDPVRCEPILLLALIQNILQAADSQRNESEADEINLHPFASGLLLPSDVADLRRNGASDRAKECVMGTLM